LASDIRKGTSYTDKVFEALRQERADISSSEFHDCVFTRCSFAETTFRECRFVDCAFQHCDLSLVQLPGSSFSGTCFEDSKLIGVDWTRASWTKIMLGDPISFLRCIISHSTFIGLDLKGILIKESTAIDVDFREANLEEASFDGTDLAASLFGSTNLAKANLSKALNYQIVPKENVLTGARFSLPEALSLLVNLDIVLVDRESNH
jgi:fluoroquinolone resistance protein